MQKLWCSMTSLDAADVSAGLCALQVPGVLQQVLCGLALAVAPLAAAPAGRAAVCCWRGCHPALLQRQQRRAPGRVQVRRCPSLLLSTPQTVMQGVWLVLSTGCMAANGMPCCKGNGKPVCDCRHDCILTGMRLLC